MLIFFFRFDYITIDFWYQAVVNVGGLIILIDTFDEGCQMSNFNIICLISRLSFS